MLREAIHPGEFLADELEALDMSAAELGRLLKVPSNRLSQIIAGKRNLTADTALRLGRYFGTGPQIWMNLQKSYELDVATQKLADELEHIPQRKPSAAVTAAAARAERP